MIYAVIDTNVFVSAFITHNFDSATARIFRYLFQRKIVALYNEEILAEYEEVLSRKKFNLPSNPQVINKNDSRVRVSVRKALSCRQKREFCQAWVCPPLTPRCGLRQYADYDREKVRLIRNPL